MNRQYSAKNWYRLVFACLLASTGLSYSSGAPPAVAQPNEVIQLPERIPITSFSPVPQQPVSQSGLELKVDTRWADTYGYRRLRFTFASPQPAARDCRMTVRFYADDWDRNDFRLWVEQDGELKAGEPSVAMDIRAPQYDSWSAVRWDVWIDGVKEPLLSVDRPHAIPFNRWQQGGLTLFYPILDPDSTATYSGSMPVGNTFYGVQTIRATGPLPEEWLDYSCYDFVVMKLDDLIAESTHHPERIDALRQWLRTGGNLWVEQAGELPDRLTEVDELFGFGKDPLPQPADSKTTLPNGWSYLSFETAKRRNDGRGESNDENPFEPIWKQLLARSEQDSRDWFAEREVGFGTVTTFVDEWSDVPNQLRRGVRRFASRRWAHRMWLPRHGLAPNMPNREFSNFLIPGVGLAPVTEFQVLITIFVLLIGPLNYWVLSRAKRLYLLVLTVPLGAAAVTLLLFSYAFLADGFATQLRARSLTILDQPRGEATSWSRLSYYAGIAPSEGLRFPADTVVYPILSEYAGRSERSESGRTVVWTADAQELRRGWLPSRTPTQYLAIRTHESDARLEVRATADRCQVTNRLGARLVSLLVVDESGDLWHGSEIELEQQIVLTKSDRVEAMRVLRESMIENRPQLPPDLQAAVDALRRSERRNRGNYGPNRFREELEFRLSNNLLENNLEALAELAGGSTDTQLPPRSYLAITTEVVDTPLGYSNVEQVDGYHLILGRW